MHIGDLETQLVSGALPPLPTLQTEQALWNARRMEFAVTGNIHRRFGEDMNTNSGTGTGSERK